MDETNIPPELGQQRELESLSLPGNVCITDSEEAFSVIQSSVLGLWEVVNSLATIRPAKRERYRVTIFGSARMQPESALYHDVRWLAGELTVMGCDIITGGGPGLMQAANEGSVRADPSDRTQSVGIRVDLDFEQHTNPFVEKVYQHRTFFSRLHHFVLQSDAFVVVPGGIGTALEALMIWQLLQVRRLQATPLIMIGPMWADLVKWSQLHMLKTDPPMADPVDTQIPDCVDSFEAAIAILRQAQASWQQSASSCQ
jgi:predicted Rossmann-fold nucleotide-binding protein